MKKFRVEKHIERKVRIMGLDVNRFVIFAVWFLLNLFVFISIKTVGSFIIALLLVGVGLVGMNQVSDEFLQRRYDAILPKERIND